VIAAGSPSPAGPRTVFPAPVWVVPYSPPSAPVFPGPCRPGFVAGDPDNPWRDCCCNRRYQLHPLPVDDDAHSSPASLRCRTTHHCRANRRHVYQEKFARRCCRSLPPLLEGRGGPRARSGEKIWGVGPPRLGCDDEPLHARSLFSRPAKPSRLLPPAATTRAHGRGRGQFPGAGAPVLIRLVSRGCALRARRRAALREVSAVVNWLAATPKKKLPQ